MLVWGGGAVALALTWPGLRLSSWQVRLAAAAAGGALIATTFAISFPNCLAGPYGAVPEALRPAWLELTGEALSFGNFVSHHPTRAAIVFGPTLAAAIAAWIGAFRTSGDGQRLLFASAALLTLTFVLCLFQIRAIYVGCALIPIAAGWGLDRILANLTGSKVNAPRAIALLLAGLFFFELPWVAAAQVAERLDLTAAAEPRDPDKMRSCFRDLPKTRSLPTGVILGPIDLGAHILFLTDHAIIAAGYHRNVEGIVAGLTAFSGTEADLATIAARDGADYVALCRPWIERIRSAMARSPRRWREARYRCPGLRLCRSRRSRSSSGASCPPFSPLCPGLIRL